MMRGDDVLAKYTHYNRFWSELKKFYRLSDDFFSEQSYIRYEGIAIQIEKKGAKTNARITRHPNFSAVKHNLKLCFLPSERNLLSAIQNIENLYRSKDVDMLFNYLLEWGEARSTFHASHPLPLVFVDHMKYHYDVKNGDMLTLGEGRPKIRTYYASSGVQSALPVQLLATYLAEEVGASAKISPMEYLRQVDVNDPNELKTLMTLFGEIARKGGTLVQDKLLQAFPSLEASIKGMQERLIYRSFHLFIEEIEQNLFPLAQFQLVKYLIQLLRRVELSSGGHESTLFLTTHSPYVLTALNVMMLASEAYRKSPEKVASLGLEDCVLPENSISAYCIQNGCFEDLVDQEYHLIKGEYLDAVSDWVDDYTYELNSILYGHTEG